MTIPTQAVGSSPDPMEQAMDAAATVVGVAIPEQHRAGVLVFYRLAAALAAQVNSFPLPAHIDAAPVYEPQPRESDR
jgi:hypothetical protein